MKAHYLAYATLITTIGLSGCKSLSATAAQQVNLSRAQNFYVVQREKGGMNQVIADELNLMGVHATTGAESAMPHDTDVMVTFDPKWQWDITMYLLELKMEFRNPSDKIVLVSGRSYRPSLQRADSSAMARETLNEMFKKVQSPAAITP